MIRIDGSFGEGGGQILRTSLSLSLVTGQSFRIENIRAGRKKPGLLRQHLTAVLATTEVSSATVEGATLGSTGLTFSPGAVKAGEYHFVIGTAGSTTLVFQTVLPALMLATAPSRIVIEGGTHNTGAPPYDFLARTFIPLVERMGPKIQIHLERYGFYPAGGGSFRADVQPVVSLNHLHLGERGEITSRRIIAIVANLQKHIAQREVDSAAARLHWGNETHVVQSTRESASTGNVAMVEIGSAEVTELFTAFGALGVSAEQVGNSVAGEAREYLESKAVAGEHLTDQLLLPMALAGGGSFTAMKINLHARTNMEVIAKFLPVRFQVEQQADCVKVTVEK